MDSDQMGVTSGRPVVAAAAGLNPPDRADPTAPALSKSLYDTDEVRVGRLVLDGDVILPADGSTITERRRLSFSGLVTVALPVGPEQRDGQRGGEAEDGQPLGGASPQQAVDQLLLGAHLLVRDPQRLGRGLEATTHVVHAR